MKCLVLQAGLSCVSRRISPEKRADRAIEIAKRVQIHLKIAANMDRVDVDYFETVVEPQLCALHSSSIGEIGDGKKEEFLGNAYALFPIDWPEPFGRVMIEALVCRTPVVA
jgi:glycosyltransferase involved in cell wall biosynthesis